MMIIKFKCVCRLQYPEFLCVIGHFRIVYGYRGSTECSLVRGELFIHKQRGPCLLCWYSLVPLNIPLLFCDVLGFIFDNGVALIGRHPPHTCTRPHQYTCTDAQKQSNGQKQITTKADNAHALTHTQAHGQTHISTHF